MSRRRDDQGAAAIFLLMLAVVMLLVAGLVVDGGLGINARMRVADDAEQASRAGASAIDVGHLRAHDGQLVLDPEAARQEASSFLMALGYGPSQFSVAVVDDRVTVTVRDRTETVLLNLVGLRTFEVRADATSSPRTEG